MGRKRIIIEGDDDDNEEQYKVIASKLDEILKKLTAPWVLPALLIVLTASMTFINYRVQRHYSNADLYKNKLKEKIAELRAAATVDFLKRSIESLDTLDVTFESYCKFDTSAEEEEIITYTLIRFNSLIVHQLAADSNLKRKLTAYTEYVAKTADACTFYPGKNQLEKRYDTSFVLYTVARKGIETTLENLTR